MYTFNEILHIPGKNQTEFHFSLLQRPQGPLYYVMVMDDPSCPVFTMSPDRNGWRIIQAPAVPAWVLALEEQLSRILIGHHPSSLPYSHPHSFGSGQ